MWLYVDEKTRHLSDADLVKTVRDKIVERQQEDKINTTFSLFRSKAFKEYHNDGEIEIDTDAIVSLSDDGGAYVMAWVWTYGYICSTCDCLYEDGGDGYDEFCPACADYLDKWSYWDRTPEDKRKLTDERRRMCRPA
jgi:hypothetical protein